MARIGIIGGSGLDDPDILKDPIDEVVRTPYGDPSSAVRLGTIEGCRELGYHHHPAGTGDAGRTV